MGAIRFHNRVHGEPSWSTHVVALAVVHASALAWLASSAQAQSAAPTHTLREEMRIVSIESNPDMQLTGISELTVLPDGRMITVHSMEPAVRLFDNSGKFVRMIGRKGRGPGELERPGSSGVVRCVL